MATALGQRIVDAVDVRIFSINWVPWISGATILTSVWDAAGLVDEQEYFTDTTTLIKLSGFVLGASYTVYNKVTISDGETRRVSFDVECR